MLFIKLNDKNKNTYLIFYIDYKKTIKEDTKVYYYSGDITWNGYFYDPHMRKMKIMLLSNKDLKELNEFLGLRGDNYVYPPTKESQVDASSGLVITRNAIKTKKVNKYNSSINNNGSNNNKNNTKEKPKKKRKGKKKTKKRKVSTKEEGNEPSEVNNITRKKMKNKKTKSVKGKGKGKAKTRVKGKKQ